MVAFRGIQKSVLDISISYYGSLCTIGIKKAFSLLITINLDCDQTSTDVGMIRSPGLRWRIFQYDCICSGLQRVNDDAGFDNWQFEWEGNLLPPVEIDILPGPQHPPALAREIRHVCHSKPYRLSVTIASHSSIKPAALIRP
jgi:hypothetical protein